ncbi:MAG: bifunctional riboflavin kinase/FAD synthetase [Thermoguttaceae bacterium]|jgi:riboflavin kinase/FMN adenylyltransferase
MGGLFRQLHDLPERFRGGVLSVGNFDGVHLGHARIVERLRAMAGSLGAPAVILTFDPHPARLLRPEEPPAPLCWPERKAELLAELGVDAVLAYPTDLAFLQLTPREFFDRIVLGGLQARGLVEGRNFFFGHNRGGTVAALAEFCAQAAIPLEVVEPELTEGRVVSSSRLRRLIAQGRIDEARPMLTRPYRIRGRVVAGQGRGNRLGYPTANLAQVDTLLPGAGIYAGRARLDSAAYPAAVSIGPNPTFGETTLKVEAFLLDYQGDLYARQIEVDFFARLRDVRRFDSAEQLVAQMARDVEQTRLIGKDRS